MDESVHLKTCCVFRIFELSKLQSLHKLFDVESAIHFEPFFECDCTYCACVHDGSRVLHRKFDVSKLLASSARAVLTEPVSALDFAAERNEHVAAGEVICAVAHPATYLNKVLIGYSSGRMQLWNINTGHCLYTFARLAARGAAITVIEPSPLLDVVAVGFGDGMVRIHNVRTDEAVMQFEHFNRKASGRRRGGTDPDPDSGAGGGGGAGLEGLRMDGVHGRIHGLSFRTDGVAHLVSVGSDNDIVVWNLKKRTVENVHYGAHRGRIVSARFIEEENLLVTSSTDNSLKMWILDDDGDSAASS